MPDTIIRIPFVSRRTALMGLAATTAWPAHAQAPAARAGACMLTPEVTEGPYYFDPKLVRRDITEGRAGSPLILSIGVVEASCSPVSTARVDVWHCDAQGNYSGFKGMEGGPPPGGGFGPPPGGGRRGPPPGGRGPGGRGGPPRQQADTSEHFLRGTQMADAKGDVEFATIFPGWYQGRTTHIHLKVWLGENQVLTSQLFFPENLNAAIYKQAAYQRAGGRDTLNANDGIAQEQGPSGYGQVTELPGGGHKVRLVLGVDRVARSRGF